MAVGDLTERQACLLRLMRDSRPCRITAADVRVTRPFLRHLARMGWVDLKEAFGDWSATITTEGVRRLWRHHMDQDMKRRTSLAGGNEP